ncbi:centromere-associated protein E isoform X3 [Alligator mississippiensis]|uniref:centromere-associated protein E isoform X3 n=1 Tax=Alligator mississippiensis TaxID=8496 RepID=UPI002877BF4C|nr:centromere-associated protein E isoform X3 [Alligator mississippiensis]
MAQSKPGPSPHSVVQPGYASEGKGQSEESLGDLKIQTAVEAWAVAASGVTVSTGGGGAMVEEGAVTVCVRVRPLIASENGALQEKAQLHWQSENCTVSQVDGMKSFIYDRVFHSHDSTEKVYEGVAVPIIKSAVQGYNGTIFAYGQTASGKTYTMMGNDNSIGIIPKAIHDIFKLICAIPDREFLLRVSYMEIYNETITDLLCDNRKKKPLGIREDVNRNTYVEDLIEEVVVAPEQVLEWIRKGEKNRHYGETKMNQHSSRSHTIFRMIIESRERSDPANTNCDGAVMVSHLNLVDLAGSERARQTGAEGLRLKEGCNINRSLFILGQVIKKLCDDPSCFINYRDSKLTRILQNSLGGNAKTVIICTVTPVSFDETLSTLQFANTAKRMKNTPKVNEVLDDDALLKRYRKEILDLKKQLEEVSSTTHLHAMEKDQLAQLLEEKNSLQKVQEDKIRNLTEMLVTSASFSSKQDFKAKRKRRVTWAPGKVSQKDNVNYLTSFEMPSLTDYKKLKTSLSALPDVEDSTLSEYSECDFQSLPTPDSIVEVEWTSGQNMDWSQDFAESIQLCETLALEKDIAVNEANVLQASFDNLVLENEQLKQEISELKVKLKEKIETDEFEELEKQMQKDHEAELKSKLEQFKRKESKIQNLEKQVEELQKSGIEKKEESLSLGDSDKLTDEIQQLNKSLIDTKTVALDAKKESAFLRSENLELKERMNEVLNNYKQMEKEVQLYQSQLEAGKVSYKKMQADLQRELQSAFQENTKLNSILEGKVPNELLSLVELEREAAGLKTELNKALEENVCLQKEVDSLSEFRSLPDKVKMLQKEMLEKSDELCLLKSEREKLVSEVADKETQLKGMSEEIRNSKQALEAAQLKYDQEYIEFKHCHEELEQKCLAASEENEQMKLQVEHLANDTQKHKTALDDVRLELSRKMQELQEKTAEQEQLCGVKEELEQAQQWLYEMEQLKEQLKISESRMEAKEVEGQTIVQKLHESREEIRAVIQDRDELKQKYDSLQTEMDQLREDIKETVTMNILAHEELRDAQSSLKQYQQNIKELEEGLLKKRSEIVNVQESLQATIGELELKVMHLTEELKQVSSERNQLTEEINTKSKEENDQLQLLKEQVLSVTGENTTLQEKLEGLLLEKEPCKECSSPIQQLQEKSIKQEQLLLLREEMSQAQQKFHEVEEIKYNESRMESLERTKIVPAPKLYDCQEMNAVIQERDYLKMQLEALQHERDYLKDMMQETSPTSSKDQELINAHGSLKQHQEMTEELKRSISEKESQLSEVQEVLGQTINELKQKVTQVTENLTGVSLEHEKLLAEKEHTEQTMNECIYQQLQNITSLTQARDDLQQMLEDMEAERDQLKDDVQENRERSLKIQAEMENLQEELKQQQEQVDIQKNLLAEREKELQKTNETLTEETTQLQEKIFKLNEELNLATREKHQLLDELTERIEAGDYQLHQEQNCSFAHENDQLQQMLVGVRAERDKLEADLQERTEESMKIQVEMENLQEELKHQEELADIQKNLLAEREKELQRTKEKLTEETTQLQEKSLKIQAEMEKLQEEVEYQKEQVVIQKNLLAEKEKKLHRTEEKLIEETMQLQEKIEKLNEELNLATREKHQLLDELREKTEDGDNQLHQLEKQSCSLAQERDQLQQMLACVTAEKDKLEADLQESIEKSLKIQADMENLQKELNQQKEQVDIQNSLLAEKEKELQRAEENLTEEKTQLQEKIEKLNELVLTNHKRLQLLDVLREETEMKDKQLQQLEKHSSSLTQEKDQLQQVLEDVRAEKDQLEAYLQESTEKSLKIQADMVNLQKELKQQKEQVDIQNNLLAEREKELQRAEEETTQLQEKILETQKELKQHQELINNEKNKAEGREAELLKVQRQSEFLEAGLKDKIHLLTDALTNISCERDQLLAEKNNISLKLQEQISSMNQEKDELQKILEGITSERDQLKTDLQKAINMCNETNEKLELALDQLKQKKLNDVAVQSNLPDNEEQIHSDSLEAKALEVKLLLEKFPKMEKRYDCFTTMSLNLESQLNSQKEQIDLILKQLSSEPAKQVKRLQTENERISSYLQSLLKKLQFLFSRTCLKKGNYYGTVNKCEMELLDKKREVIKQQIVQDMSAMETEALGLEDELQQEQRARQEAIRFLEMCSETCDVEKLKDCIKQENERLLKMINLWTPKVKPHFQALLDIDRETANYCQNFETELNQRKEKTEDMLQELKTTKEQLTPCSTANHALEEENYRLCNKLKTTKQDVKIMKAEVKKLENTLIEMEKNVKEKEERIAVLLSELKRRSATSELTQLHAKLNETEKYLKSTLTEKETLEVKLNKGAELYKEEIDNLKTQLVKSDMERMKQSKFFERETANAKALAKHKEEQLRKLKEELRRAQQEQNVSVISEKELPQASQIPLTCGGGSGIVQSTQMLVLKSEQVKLQKENLHLKKQNDLLLSNEHQLKKELTKWKERALKLREVSSRGVSQEMIPRSPKKTASLPCKEQILSPKEHNSQAILPLDTPKHLPPTCPTNFFDNSSLGTLIDARPGGIEPTEEQYKHWLGVSEKDEAPDCTTQ